MSLFSDDSRVKIRQKHDYTSELELKSLLIRLQNWNRIKDQNEERYKLSNIDIANNKKVNRYIKLFIKLKNNENDYNKVQSQKSSALRNKLKETVIKISEVTPIDKESYEKFGSIIVLMIKSILTKHQFSGYSYKDDFYSDSIHKILKYLRNFNHKLISVRTGTEVNAFAYISQIIHNSIIYIIKLKNKEQEQIKDVISLEIIYGDIDLKQVHKKADLVRHYEEEVQEQIKIKIDSFDNKKLLDIINEVHADVDADETLKNTKFVLEYPKNYKISFDEYEEIAPLLKGRIDIVRSHA